MNLPVRRSARLKNYDYSSPGAYFITVCTHKRKAILSHIVGEIHESPENILTDYGLIVKNIIESLPARFDVSIPKYVIMPNHIHMIVQIYPEKRAVHEPPLRSERSVMDKLVGFMKMNASKKIHLTGGNKTVWQRSYHDHIIRNENDYKNIWLYIDSNVRLWEKDCFYKKESQ